MSRRRSWLLGRAPLGPGQGGGQSPAGAARGAYLLKDEFTTNVSAGSLNGTLAEPGPGVRFVSDPGNDFSIATDKLTVAGGADVGGVWYPALARDAGRILLWQISALFRFHCGFDNDQASTVTGNSFREANSSELRCYYGDVASASHVVAANTSYTRFAIALRATGALFFVHNGTHWVLLWADSRNTDPWLRPALVKAADTTATFDYVRIPRDRWLPAPLLSDGFSAAASDGLGHADGIIGGIGAGGNDVAWVNTVGAWAYTGGAIQAATLSGGQAIRIADVGTADVLAGVNLARNGGSGSVIVRFADADNYVRAGHDGTNATLIKRVAGVETTLVNVAATYSAGTRLWVSCSGQKFRLYYNDTFVGTEQTIADAGLASGTAVGLRTTDAGNSFDDCVVYARGTGGEYDTVLNAI